MTADGLLDSKHVAVELDVPESAIWKWKARGALVDGVRRHLTPAGVVPGRGRGGLVPLYRLADVKPFADAYHENKRRRAEKQ
ncbi:hypothetical protein QWY28_17295 [Nocardioides sp. SOB77]|uniref:DNA-binding protein n=1 Tax=Nocardioides oceani TaxID=3058369 RepID=A0ABT8FJU9_9ACTN|nr:hypothetical protein [Nocardioides oceani]MDN4174720.1 hypothetical protein [Nocardioides oceani]